MKVSHCLQLPSRAWFYWDTHNFIAGPARAVVPPEGWLPRRATDRSAAYLGRVGERKDGMLVRNGTMHMRVWAAKKNDGVTANERMPAGKRRKWITIAVARARRWL